jgi:hypothetical protein
MGSRTRILLIFYLLCFAFLLLWVPWDVDRRLEAITFHGGTYYGWVWAAATPRQRDGSALAGRFGAIWRENKNPFNDIVDAAREHREPEDLPVGGGWNFDATKQFMHVAWLKVIAEELALTAFAFAVLLGLLPRSRKSS